MRIGLAQGGGKGGEPQYDPTLAYEGSTSPRGKVRLGEKAFHSIPTFYRPSFRFVHADQAVDNWPKTEKARLMAEIEACAHELAEAGNTGLSPAEVETLRRRIANLKRGLPPTHRARVDHGQFRAEAVPLREAVEHGRVRSRRRAGSIPRRARTDSGRLSRSSPGVRARGCGPTAELVAA